MVEGVISYQTPSLGSESHAWLFSVDNTDILHIYQSLIVQSNTYQVPRYYHQVQVQPDLSVETLNIGRSLPISKPPPHLCLSMLFHDQT